MKKAFLTGAALLTTVVVGLGWQGLGQTAAANPPEASKLKVPIYQVDPTWPTMPTNKLLGQVSSVAVDSHDNVWLLHRFRTVKPEFKDRALPPVVEFDNAGKFIRAWGGPGDGYEWPSSEHGFGIDFKGNVWIGGEGRNVNQILEFSPEGKFMRQIGKSGANKTGHKDTENFVGPTDITFDAKTNEIFVGDTGHGAGRIVVLDYDTGKFKRMWGGSGVQSVDRGEEERGSVPFEMRPENDVDTGHDPEQLQEAHRIRISNDGLVYVCDGPQKRFEVFTVAGKFVSKVYVGRGLKPESVVPVVTTAGDAVTLKWGEGYTPVALEQMIHHHETSSGVAISTDPQQNYLFVYERSRSKALIYDRRKLEMIGEFGDGPGRAPGQFFIMHDLRADSHNNVFIAEVNIGSRVQKFLLKGYLDPLKK